MQQQAALVAATTGQAAGAPYLSPITGLPTAQIAPAAALNGLANAVCTPTSGNLKHILLALKVLGILLCRSIT